MIDKRKIKLLNLNKKIIELSKKYPNVNLNDLELKKVINDYQDLKQKSFHLKFEIEHCECCSQLLPKYK